MAEKSPGEAKASQGAVEYWSHGEGAAKIRWGAPHDWDRCVVQLSKYLPPEEVKGYCAKLHHRALGVWPGQEDDSTHRNKD